MSTTPAPQRLPYWLPLLACISVFANPAHAQGWPHDVSDIAPDPTVTYGQLPNGVRYIIMPNSEPPGQVSMRFAVDSGSLHETDDQRGLAHFLEHMAFNGTRNFPGTSMAEYFQRLGMDFGPDTNAYTSFDETVYFVELPDADPELLEDGFRLMRDYADGLLLEIAEIESERGIILAEKRDRDSPSYRDFVASWNFMLPESRMVQRLPIGIDEVIKGASREDFVDFYTNYYRADRLMIIVVGDITVEQIQGYMERHFADLPTPESALPEPDLGPIPANGLRFGVHGDPELPEVNLSIYTTEPFDRGPDSRDRRIDEITLSLANSIIGRRFEILARADEAVFTSGNAYSWDYMDHFQVKGIDINTTPENWRAAMNVLTSEWRRARQYGFTQAEISEAVARTLNAYQEAVRKAPTRQNRALSSSLRSAVNDNRVFVSPEARLELAESVLSAITPEVLHSFFAKAWDSENLNVYASGNLPASFTTDSLRQAYSESLLLAVEAPAEETVPAFAYTDFGTPGSIVERTAIEDLDIHQLTYANQVRVSFKQTDFEAETIHISIRFGGGQVTQSRDMPALNTVAEATFLSGGLGEHSIDQLDRILAGHTVNKRFSVGDDAFTLYGQTNPDDLLLTLQVLTAYLTDPAYRPEALSQYRRGLPALYQQVLYDPVGVWRGHVTRFLRSGDMRFGIPLQADAEARSLEEVKEWLADPLRTGFMEVGIVGDFDEEALIEALDATLGALPAREMQKPGYENGRRLAFPSSIEQAIFRYPSEIDRALVAVSWPTTDGYNASVSRRLNMLGWILGDRMRVRVREGTGEAYSPYAFSFSSENHPQFGYITGLVFASTDSSQMFAELVQELGLELGEKGVTAEELQRGIETTLSDLKDELRSNRYWLNGVVAPSASEPYRLDWVRSVEKDIPSITVEELNQLAAEYLQTNRTHTVKIIPTIGSNHRASEVTETP